MLSLLYTVINICLIIKLCLNSTLTTHKDYPQKSLSKLSNSFKVIYSLLVKTEVFLIILLPLFTKLLKKATLKFKFLILTIQILIKTFEELHLE